MKFPAVIKAEADRLFLNVFPFGNVCQGMVESLQEKGVNDWITLAVPAESVMLFNPMTGEKGKAQTRKQEGKTQVHLQLHSGESVILQ